jgi:DNA-binding response OmpR family regulator
VAENGRERVFRAATVLVAEDEDAIRTMVREVLRAAGYEVLEAPNATEALRIHELHRDRIDLLLTDIAMPDVNGVELARQLSGKSSNLRTLFMSGFSANSLLDGAFLQKPFTPSELTVKIREVLDERPTPVLA